MPQWVKILAVLCCLLPFVYGWAMRTGHELPLRRLDHPRTAAEMQAADEANKTRGTILIGLGELGALLLLIDAFRRQYEAPKAWPIAIAVLGLITIGLSSLVYYVIWGWQPARPEQPRAADFCDACKGETSDRPAPAAVMFNALLGTRFLGRFARCAECGSSIRTLWFWLVVPVVPLGSYRMLPAGEARVDKAWFLSRRAPWNLGQIGFVYGCVALIVLGVFWIRTWAA